MVQSSAVHSSCPVDQSADRPAAQSADPAEAQTLASCPTRCHPREALTLLMVSAQHAPKILKQSLNFNLRHIVSLFYIVLIEI